MPRMKTYGGGCHCGKVRYEVSFDLGTVMACNCSICGKRGTLLAFVTPDQFKLLKGDDALTDYQFNTMNIHHLFCTTCGIGSFGRGTGPGGKAMVAVNTRCLDDVDVKALEVKWFDGKSL